MSITQLSPDELVAESWVLRDTSYDKAMSTIIQAQCRKKCTRDKELKRDLESQMNGFRLSVNQVQSIVKWMIQNSPGRDIFGILGVKTDYSLIFLWKTLCFQYHTDVFLWPRII